MAFVTYPLHCDVIVLYPHKPLLQREHVLWRRRPIKFEAVAARNDVRFVPDLFLNQHLCENEWNGISVLESTPVRNEWNDIHDPRPSANHVLITRW